MFGPFAAHSAAPVSRTGSASTSCRGENPAPGCDPFRKRRADFLPSLCPAFRDLVGQMEQQHEQIRELEQHVAEMLSDPPQVPDSRWLNDLRMFGSQFHDFIQHHIVDEEDNLLRLAESQLTREDQERLAAEMIRLHDRRIVNFSGEKEPELGIEGEIS